MIAGSDSALVFRSWLRVNWFMTCPAKIVLPGGWLNTKNQVSILEQVKPKTFKEEGVTSSFAIHPAENPSCRKDDLKDSFLVIRKFLILAFAHSGFFHL